MPQTHRPTKLFPDVIPAPVVPLILLSITVCVQLAFYFGTMRGNTSPQLDLYMGRFTPAEAFKTIAQHGPAGRSNYLNVFAPIDTLYMACYTWLAASVLGKRLGWLILPVLIADMVQNICVAGCITAWPRRNERMAEIGGWANGIKWLWTIVVLGAIAGKGISYLLISNFDAKSGSPSTEKHQVTGKGAASTKKKRK
ncbi:hypothetical protein DFS34DRAFT_112699 [Phlyctochytrium arcticum]|nr:hypothetical protein DFS34DRAFT_112699 [Phlyctochytrium arcticum]